MEYSTYDPTNDDPTVNYKGPVQAPMDNTMGTTQQVVPNPNMNPNMNNYDPTTSYNSGYNYQSNVGYNNYNNYNSSPNDSIWGEFIFQILFIIVIFLTPYLFFILKKALLKFNWLSPRIATMLERLEPVFTRMFQKVGGRFLSKKLHTNINAMPAESTTIVAETISDSLKEKLKVDPNDPNYMYQEVTTVEQVQQTNIEDDPTVSYGKTKITDENGNSVVITDTTVSNKTINEPSPSSSIRDKINILLDNDDEKLEGLEAYDPHEVIKRNLGRTKS